MRKNLLACFYTLLLTFFLGSSAYAQVSWDGGANTNNWGDPANWSTNQLPTNVQTVTIPGNNSVLVNISNAVAGALNIGDNTNSSATLTFASNSALTVSGIVTIGRAGNANRFGNIIMTNGGTLTCQGFSVPQTSSTFISGSGTVILTADNSIPVTTPGGVALPTIFSSFNNLTINNGTTQILRNISITGNLRVLGGSLSLNSFTSDRSASGGTIQIADNASLFIGGSNSFPSNYTSIDIGFNSTIAYNGTNQVVPNLQYGNLTLDGSGIKNINALRTIRNNFNVQGAVVTSNPGSGLSIGNSVHIGVGSTFIAGGFTHTVGGNWTNNGTFNANGSTIDFIGTGVQSIGASNFNNIAFTNGGAKSATGALSISGNVTINSNFNAGAFMHTVGGNWINNGIFTAAGSTVDFNGTTAQTISTSPFNNITFTNAGTKTALGPLSIAGNVEINSNFTTGAFTHTVGGNWTRTGTFEAGGSTVDFNGTAAQRISAGNFNNIIFSNTGVKVAEGSLNMAGNVLIGSNATFDAGGQVHTVRGNWTKDGTGVFLAPNSIVRFRGTTNQLISASNFHHIEINNSNGATVTANGNLEINGNLEVGGIFNSGVGWTHYLRGDLVNNTNAFANFSRGTNSTFVFDGTTDQRIRSINGTPQITGLNNFTINKSNSLLFVDAPVTIYGTLNFVNGYVKTNLAAPFVIGENAVVQSADPGAIPRNASFVDGPVSKRGVGLSQAAVFTFPIGKNGIYNPATISNASGQSNVVTAEYFPANPKQVFPNARLTAPGLRVISSCEYWNISKQNTFLSADITLGWRNNACGNPAYVSDPANVVIAQRNGGDWALVGPGNKPSETGLNRTDQTITWNGVTNYGTFTLGSMSLSNILPVTFAHFTATQREEGIQLAFSNLTEEDVAVYHVERSANGTDFQSIGSLAPKANTNSRTDYTFLDKLPMNGANYYRIRALETTGKVVYSDVVMLRTNGKQNSFVLYPNPARIQSTLSLQMGNLPAGRYQVKVFNHLGQLLRLTQFSHSGGFVSTPLSTQGMAAGTYFIELSGGRQQVQRLVLQ